MAAATTANNYELEPLNHSEHHKFNNNSRESKICDGKSKYLIIIGILTILIIIAITLGTTVSLPKGATTTIEESQNIRGKGPNLGIHAWGIWGLVPQQKQKPNSKIQRKNKNNFGICDNYGYLCYMYILEFLAKHL